MPLYEYSVAAEMNSRILSMICLGPLGSSLLHSLSFPSCITTHVLVFQYTEERIA